MTDPTALRPRPVLATVIGGRVMRHMRVAMQAHTADVRVVADGAAERHHGSIHMRRHVVLVRGAKPSRVCRDAALRGESRTVTPPVIALAATPSPHALVEPAINEKLRGYLGVA